MNQSFTVLSHHLKLEQSIALPKPKGSLRLTIVRTDRFWSFSPSKLTERERKKERLSWIAAKFWIVGSWDPCGSSSPGTQHHRVAHRGNLARLAFGFLDRHHRRPSSFGSTSALPGTHLHRVAYRGSLARLAFEFWIDFIAGDTSEPCCLPEESFRGLAFGFLDHQRIRGLQSRNTEWLGSICKQITL